MTGLQFAWELFKLTLGVCLILFAAIYTIARFLASAMNIDAYQPNLVHDLGYLGKPNMDGPEGEQHPLLGGAIMRRLFGEPWGSFTLLHSRFLARQQGREPSVLCVADKLAMVITPRWLYLPMVRATGEIREYMSMSAHRNETGGKYAHAGISIDDEVSWHRDMTAYMRRWVDEHRDGRADTWTPSARRAVSSSGVWQ